MILYMLAAGYLSAYSEMVDEEVLSGAEIVRRVAYDTSVNPRLLLALLEYRAGWVRGCPCH
jgi:LasA protease